MLIMRKYAIAIFLTTLFFLSFKYFFAPTVNMERCGKLEEIARNQEIIQYLRAWIDQNITDKVFLMHMGPLGRSSMLDDPEHFKKLNLNVEFIGIHPSYAFVALNRRVADSANYMDWKTINSVSIGEGRNSIVIILNNQDEHDLGIEGINNDKMAIIYKIDKDVAVVCR